MSAELLELIYTGSRKTLAKLELSQIDFYNIPSTSLII
ncbi:hypothetical protein FOXG_22736 [Fusarium oxysporum f. sp. lycopersici 4287]|uniref:Uncharacterized protein n=1 Tax=Fusarium oxysporum f. sp. lycopersici (strain 4287 / CBS 123668 / FGSC 9935 / NRRL 34936) TaxID=426428 RepID=A0A0J9WB10_FUSO4|nr:uncharacterized protein FOXG_22736 [Fusarium oxysporum f. sp. lycopersici 4287]KNB20053.1 hypothetical protein FOXG_22736 [Fusarium oxysporum f. sp. lycopersici 4287]